MRNQELFDLMAREHGLTLLESEMHEIELTVARMLATDREHEAARQDGAELGAAPGSAKVSGAPQQSGAGGWRDEITCPHCGYEAMESYDWGCPDVDWTEITECPQCEKQFEWTRLKTVQYLALPVAGVGGKTVDAGPGHSPSEKLTDAPRETVD